MPKKKYNAGLKYENPSLFYLLPIAFIISVVPLIVYMKVVELTPIEIKNWYGEQYYTDFFSYYKSQWLLAGTVFAVFFFIVYSLVHKFQVKKSFAYIPAILYAMMVVLSTVFSDYKEVALRGFVARYEGMYVLLSYVALFLITFNLVKGERQIKFLMGALLLCSFVIGLIGVFQFIGLDIFRTGFGKQLLLPKEYENIADNIQFRFGESNVYATLSNPNFVGSYTALLLPVAFAAFVYLKNTYLKIGAALLNIILLLCLFGSRSRAGMMGLGVTLLFGLILFRRYIFKYKMISLISVIFIVVSFTGVNHALDGILIDRIVAEFRQNVDGGVQYFDLQDIVFDNDTVSIISSSETLAIKNADNKLYFYDDEGNMLDHTLTEGEASRVTFKDEKYRDYIIDINGDVLTVRQKRAEFQLRVGSGGFKLIGINGDETNNIKKPESVGFAGKERMGSARAYIWSRTLPMIKDTIILGNGPDTYAIAFPQYDYIGKIRAYGTPQMIVDKPHNTYLQIATNTGLLSLLAFLALCGFYLLQSAKLYIKNVDSSFTCLAGVGIFLAACAFLTAALANDSVVAVAPIFWILLGLGLVCNRLVLANTVKKDL